MKVKEILALAQSLQADILETHISWILLTPRFAYKIKKPVKTNFLDFSTLAKRKKYCYRELELNKAIAPAVYLEVVGIQKEKGTFIFVAGHLHCMEYAIKMKRLNLSRQMDYMLLSNKVQVTHLLNLAQSIAVFHAHTDVISQPLSEADMLKRFKDLVSLQKEFHDYLSGTLYQQAMASVKTVDLFIKKNYNLFTERASQGFIRDCHGDLHTGNIFLYKKPVLFDRIEFNDRFRHIDILHEMAFLCMDLEAYGKKGMSRQLLQNYLSFSGIPFGKKERLILNYYKCYTANVRAKINLLRAAQDSDNPLHVRQAKNYLQLMLYYVQKLNSFQ